ncbi:MAG: TetR/AcrR family transcriptional regulator [Elusimicrobia bacterium]|nr:TetR/AcrR family transcriptional regulator [Elusimicrobiota bacterium]
MPETLAAVDNRQRILDAAAELFGRQGFHGTSTRDIAKSAGVSLGNIYNHFRTKDELFVELLERYREEYFRPDQPLAVAMASGSFPDNVEEIGRASRETVRRFAPYMRLIYVDVVEFDAAHVGPVFRAMRDRYTALLKSQGVDKKRFRVDPVAALMMTTWGFFTYFITEKLFGVQRHYGMSDDEVIRLFATVIRHGALHGREA